MTGPDLGGTSIFSNFIYHKDALELEVVFEIFCKFSAKSFNLFTQKWLLAWDISLSVSLKMISIYGDLKPL